MKKQHILKSVAAMMLYALSLSAQAQSRPIVYDPDIMLKGMSDNAAYAIGSKMGDEDVDNPQSAGGTLVDLATHDKIEIPAPGGWADVNDVADNGIVVGSSYGKPAYWNPSTGEWTRFDVPSIWGGGCFTAVTPDAHYAVGYYYDPTNVFFVAPMYYDLTTGKNIELPNLPTVDLSGEYQNQNVFFGISPDGRYILGQMSQSYLMPVALFSYVYDTHTDTWKPIGYTYDHATQKYKSKVDELHYVDSQFMGAGGVWVTGTAYMVHDGGESVGGSEGYYPYRYNIANDEMEVYYSSSDGNIGGNKITADGVLLGASPMGNPYPTAQVRCGKYFITLDQIFEQVYGISTPDLIHDPVTGAFEALSADGRTALMTSYDNSYIITMPEPFVDAAAKVDLLGNYSVNIPDGSLINRVAEIQITFERSIDCLNYPQNVRLLDSQGNTVRTASGISISRVNDHTLVVTFRSTSLTPGETYTVDIPADMVWLKDDPSKKAKNIQIHYVGRNNGPVEMKAAMPANGSAIAQLNSNPDYITVLFDTPVTISQDALCTLYNADDGTAITSMMATSEGHRAYFFPLSTYQLYKGSNYKVVISAGSVTDLSGSGGNEEIVLDYVGAYVRQLSSDDIYLFNAPCDSYDNFIFWASSTHQNYQPAAIPASWGFTNDNSWLLLRDNDQSTDWALAAHSMFSPAATSDAWLVIPQLFIPDANTFLAFDSQSYLRIRDDNLKVYIYENDAVYNYFSQDLADLFRENAELVFDEIVPAGDTDEGLEGEWTHYTIPLDKYAGKNVYIAFVYNNFNKSAIFIDDVQVIRNMNFMLTNQTPVNVVDVDHLTVKGILTIGSELNTYQGINLTLSDADGNIVDEINDPNATLVLGDAYNFTFSRPLEITPGYEWAYTIKVASGDDETAFEYTVKDLVFEPVKRVVLEEYTGSACGNCPLGILAIENLQRLYPDNFIAVTLRTYMNDIYATGITDYTSFLGLNAAPTGRINRGAILAPMMQNGSEGYTFYGRGIVTSDGSEGYLWADAVQDELNIPAEASIEFTSTYIPLTGEINIPCTVRFALERKDLSVGVFAVVLENNLPTYQLNYFNGISDPNLGPWGAGGMYSQQTVTSWQAMDVARYVVSGSAFNGTSPQEYEFAPDTDYTLTLNATIPNGRLTNPDNCHVVVMLIDRSTGRVINANHAKFGTSGIIDAALDTDTPAEYYDLQGIKVMNPEKGHIYIRVAGGKASKIRF